MLRLKPFQIVSVNGESVTQTLRSHEPKRENCGSVTPFPQKKRINVQKSEKQAKTGVEAVCSKESRCRRRVGRGQRRSPRLACFSGLETDNLPPQLRLQSSQPIESELSWPELGFDGRATQSGALPTVMARPWDRDCGHRMRTKKPPTRGRRRLEFFDNSFHAACCRMRRSTTTF
jgi:hypothetical protein